MEERRPDIYGLGKELSRGYVEGRINADQFAELLRHVIEAQIVVELSVLAGGELPGPETNPTHRHRQLISQLYPDRG